MRVEAAIIVVLLSLLFLGLSGTRSHGLYGDYAAGRCTLTSTASACGKFGR
jgi:hypothetical protein